MSGDEGFASKCAREGDDDGDFAPTHAGAREGILSQVRPRARDPAAAPSRKRQASADVDVRAIRAGLGLSQPMFAKAFGLSLGTVRDWEQGRNAPDPIARTLLLVIGHRPDVVREALGHYG